MIVIIIDILNALVWNQVCNTCWCGSDNRENKRNNLSFEDCKEQCVNDHQCDAIEFWAGSGTCYTCKNPDNNSPYTSTSDAGYPPSVYKLGKVLENNHWKNLRKSSIKI